MQDLEVEIGNIVVQASPVNGKLEGGELLVESFEANIPDGVFKEASEPFEWNEENLLEQVKAAWMETDKWPDTCVEDWEDTRFVNEDTIKWNILEKVWQMQPVKTTVIGHELDLESSASAYISKLKDDNLVACIGYEGRTQVIVATHIGAKELSVHHGLSLTYQDKSGVEALFDKDSVKSEKAGFGSEE